MSKSATNNKDRLMPRMTNTELRMEAKKAGFYYKSRCRCEPCSDELERAAQSEGYTGTTPVWANPICALKFYKKGITKAACECGWRKTLKTKAPFIPKKTIECKVRGCNHILTKTDTDGLCVLCRKEIAGGGNPATYARYCTLKPKPSGCTVYVQEGNEGCTRIKCGDYDPIAVAMAPHIKRCRRKNCNNPVPVGRKGICFTCIPQGKATKPSIHM
jgi:hypothetical protein